VQLNWLRNLDSTDIPENIDLIKQYVIFNDSIWISDYETDTTANFPKFKIEKGSMNGPKWGPNIYVDVISEIYNSETNINYYIRTKNIFIERTD